MRFPLKFATAALALSTATPALSAIVVSGTGMTTTATISSDTAANSSTTLNFATPDDAGVLAALTLTFLSAINGDYSFSYALANTSTIDPSRITVFGFNVNPALFTASVGSGDQFNVLAAGQVQGQNATVNFCLKDSSNSTGSCTSGQLGVIFGSTATGSFILDFGATTPDEIILSDLFVRFQGVGPNDDSFVTNPNGPQVPETATWATMLLGIGAVGYAIRRRRKPLLAQVA
jgi:hypothetical protein